MPREGGTTSTGSYLLSGTEGSASLLDKVICAVAVPTSARLAGQGLSPRRSERGDMVMEATSIWVVSTQYDVQMMCGRIVHLKPTELDNQCHPNTFNKTYENMK